MGGEFYISDPAHGPLQYNKKEFLERWIGKNATEETKEGIALLLETTPKFFKSKFDDKEERLGFKFLSQYILKYKRFLWQLVIGLLAASILQLIVPKYSMVNTQEKVLFNNLPKPSDSISFKRSLQYIE